MQVFDIKINRDQMDTTPHGDAPFPLAVYRSVMSRNVLGFTNWHWHDELQFCIVTQGSIGFFVNEKQHTLSAGEGIFINSGCLHMAKPLKDPDSTYVCLNAHSRLLSSFPGSIVGSRYVAPYLEDPLMKMAVLDPRVRWQKEILDGIVQVESLQQRQEFGYELEICGILISMWLQLLRNFPKGASSRCVNRTKHHAAVQSILTYIQQHYSERITLEQIARELSFSIGECCRMFKKVTGETIISHLTLYRISKSTELLRDTELSVSQIAYETGFSSTSYFIEKFKEQLGTTPLRFRNENKK